MKAADDLHIDYIMGVYHFRNRNTVVEEEKRKYANLQKL
jgi:hypothetical protein